MQLKAKENFSWAHRGVQIEHFEKGQVIDTDDEDLIEVSSREGWVEKIKVGKKESAPSDPTEQ